MVEFELHVTINIVSGAPFSTFTAAKTDRFVIRSDPTRRCSVDYLDARVVCNQPFFILFYSCQTTANFNLLMFLKLQIHTPQRLSGRDTE